MNTNPYLKTCPQCEKKFQARRLNQVYCTLFCKSQFNNAKAKARRSELIEISKKYQAERGEILSKKSEPNVTLSPPPNVKSKEEKVNNFKNIIPKFNFNKLGILVALVLCGYLIYRYFFQKKTLAIPPELIAESQVIHNDQPQNSIKIPVEIYSTKIEETADLPEKIPLEIKEINQSPTQQFYEKHPDIKAYEKILRNQNKI